MAKEKFGVTVDEEVVQEVGELISCIRATSHPLASENSSRSWMPRIPIQSDSGLEPDDEVVDCQSIHSHLSALFRIPRIDGLDEFRLTELVNVVTHVLERRPRIVRNRRDGFRAVSERPEDLLGCLRRDRRKRRS